MLDEGDQPTRHEPPGSDGLTGSRDLANLHHATGRRDLDAPSGSRRGDLERLHTLTGVHQCLDAIALHSRTIVLAGAVRKLGPLSCVVMDANEEPRSKPRTALVVALDGPGSSGKSSVGAAAALRVGYRFCDTGLLYRAVTWLAESKGAGVDDATGLVDLVDEIELAADEFGRLSRVLVDGVDRTAEVHTPPVDAAVSAVSAVPELRAALLTRQRSLAAQGGMVMAGRDIGTVVLPDADLKLFLDASVEERARRRAEERGLDPDGPGAFAILTALRRRDELDSTRPIAPLRPASDARIIATDGNRFGDTVDAVVHAIQDAEARRASEVAANA